MQTTTAWLKRWPFKRITRTIWAALRVSIPAFFILSIASAVFFSIVPIPCTPLMFQRCVQQLFDTNRNVRWKKDWENLDNISENMQLAVICAEDQKFTEHAGFDVEAISKAMEHNRTSKKKRGASTISQQTAKNVFLTPDRSWLRKGLEVYFTLLIEAIWSKKRILEVYLNIAEFGDGIYGAEAAAQHFFKKSAKKLTRAEAARLAAVLPSPLRYSAANPSKYVLKRQQWILNQMQHNTLEVEK